MPAKTQKQARFMQMVKAVQHGHNIKGVRASTKAKLRKAARSMKSSEVDDFTHTAGDYAGMSMKRRRKT